MLTRGLQEEVNEANVQYVGGGFGPPKTEDFLPLQFPEMNMEMPHFDLQTVAFWTMKNAIRMADIETIGATLEGSGHRMSGPKAIRGHRTSLPFNDHEAK